jgi:hypothetical protein
MSDLTFFSAIICMLSIFLMLECLMPIFFTSKYYARSMADLGGMELC